MEEKNIVIFNTREEKKHSVCYKTDDKDAAVTSIYVMKRAFKKMPTTVKVTIEPIEPAEG